MKTKFYTILALISSLCLCLGAGFPYVVTTGGVASNLTAVGNGGNLLKTNSPLNAALLSGKVPLVALPGLVVTNSATGVTLSGTFTGNGAGLTNVVLRLTNGASASAFSITVPQNNTNFVYLAGAGTAAANDVYGWSSLSLCYTGAVHGCGIVTLVGNVMQVTNSTGDSLYVTESLPHTWVTDTSGSDPAPIGSFGTNQVSLKGMSFEGDGQVKMMGLFNDAGGYINLGSSNTVRYGIDPDNGYNHDVQPSVIMSSSDCHDIGFDNSMFSCNRVYTDGAQISVLNSGVTRVWCGLNDLTVMASEFCMVSNNNGVSVTAACYGVTNLADSSMFVGSLGHSYIDHRVNNSVVLGGSYANLYNMQLCVVSGSSNIVDTAEFAYVIGNGLRMTNGHNAYQFGSGLSSVNKTNDMQIGVQGGSLNLVGTVTINNLSLSNAVVSAVSPISVLVGPFLHVTYGTDTATISLNITNAAVDGYVLKASGTNMLWAAP